MKDINENNDDMGRIVSAAEAVIELEAFDAEMDAIFEHDKKLGCITINVAYPYRIELNRITDPESVLRWVHHLTEKTWMTTELVHEFIERVYDIKGWKLYGKKS